MSYDFTPPMVVLVGDPEDHRDSMSPRDRDVMFRKRKHRSRVVPFIRGMRRETETLCRRLKARNPTLGVFEFDNASAAVVIPLGSRVGAVVHCEAHAIRCDIESVELIERALGVWRED